ncbi:S8 family peptidase [Lactobacillus sp. LC28-10]|uniref:S8 family peptidase n=1 Tax=Secundilactobacillus angelensis TaxID=2722706 RepID=A0ABX1KU81_9LACO|nr:S8 family peptidase [Secundilactobacillus angelensis]MCH5461317.1 S8 family peptidase [Secundilactobacillus angelensis]NLR17487.1 S8 family peptidase [Secundilactobacillus angelensis]
MNDVLTLKGKFKQRKNNSRPGASQLPAKQSVDTKRILSLINDLEQMKEYWAKQDVLPKMLISAYYTKIAAKSNRLQAFFGQGISANSKIVGAKFGKNTDGNKRHIITYFVSAEDVNQTIDYARETVKVLDDHFAGKATADVFNKDDTYKQIDFSRYDISKSKFRDYVVDAYYVERFDVEEADISTEQSAIITLYDTGKNAISLLGELGIKVYNSRMLDDQTVLLDRDSLSVLMQQAPYLISMSTEDMSELAPSDFSDTNEQPTAQIPAPSDEPTIGVIDTLFDENVYFNQWVSYKDLLDPSIPREPDDYRHGTEVSSIIVDGPTLNPELDDGCGRFKVKHFGVSTHRQFSSFSVVKAIQSAVIENPEIHVWNLSLGSNAEVNQNFISAEGAILDKIQYEHNVIFVIAGTNKNPEEEMRRIGAPADSINSVVVNSVGMDKLPEKYSREGIVLSFFTKPDASYYGGDQINPMRTVNSYGEALVSGTSFSAPWIARKMAYMIDILGLSREVAKALLIDAAIGWENETDFETLSLRGNGVVPVRIEDVLHSKDDEIKFVIEGVSEMWDTYTYDLPVPVVNDKQPFNAKATLCYFPKCSRNQGVDYTNTEFDFKFGRINNKSTINDINQNTQTEINSRIKEEDARKLFRKWDNVKHVSETLKSNPRPKKVYDNPMWAISVKTKERLDNRDGEHTRFGIVITLKEMNGVNRIDDFIQQASLKGWLVNRIDVENRVEVYNQAEEDIDLE